MLGVFSRASNLQEHKGEEKKCTIIDLLSFLSHLPCYNLKEKSLWEVIRQSVK